MVHRQLIRLIAATLVVGLLLPAIAEGANRRISISDYRWSTNDIQIDLGEHVTWYWIGPDTMHSVTGDSPNAVTFDSDPQTAQPIHDIGDSYRLDFSSPGTYRFRCKLHSTVRGTITVSGNPGDPVTEPDAVPQSKVDRTPPELREISLNKRTFGKRGTNLKFSLGEVSKVAAEMYRFDESGKRRFAGYQKWRAHIGWNGVRFGGKSKRFRPRPGTYEALITATDQAQNPSKPKRIKFTIRKPS